MFGDQNNSVDDFTEISDDDDDNEEPENDDDPDWTPGKASHSLWANFQQATFSSALQLFVLEHQ